MKSTKITSIIPMQRHSALERKRISLLCLLVWTASTSIYITVSKRSLLIFPFPITTAVFHLTFGTCWALFLWIFGLRRRGQDMAKSQVQRILPSALLFGIVTTLTLSVAYHLSISSFLAFLIASAVIRHSVIFRFPKAVKNVMYLLACICALSYHQVNQYVLLVIIIFTHLAMIASDFDFAQLEKIVTVQSSSTNIHSILFITSAVASIPLSFIFDGYSVLSWISMKDESIEKLHLIVYMAIGGGSLFALNEAAFIVRFALGRLNFEKLDIARVTTSLVVISYLSGELVGPSFWACYLSFILWLGVSYISNVQKYPTKNLGKQSEVMRRHRTLNSVSAE